MKAKKTLSLLLALVMVVAAFPATVLGQTPSQAIQGVRAGTVARTDVRVFLNGVQIEGFHLGGHTFVIAEQLPHYGFNVEFNALSRAMRIRATGSPVWGAGPVLPFITPPVGAPMFNYYYTNIVVFVSQYDIMVPSYSIGNLTLVRVEDIVRPYGRTVWNEATRELHAVTQLSDPRVNLFGPGGGQFYDDGRGSWGFYTAAIDGAPFAAIEANNPAEGFSYVWRSGDRAWGPVLSFYSGLGSVVNPYSPRSVITLQRLRGSMRQIEGTIGRVDGTAMIPATAEIWGDHQLLWSGELNPTGLPTPFVINTVGVDVLRIDVNFPRGSELHHAVYAMQALGTPINLNPFI